ncbi:MULTISPECIES: cytochrome-c oxidase, cbb3-type subunit III [Shewanella]|jgi:cytochrome c oxidase cbb3-type subunit 3|uniref:Cbb3-type cytochrome c oxidase subunit n=1 Tax=Shewanella oncorhynchi TaxID=2726434 RepID=A0ABX1KTW3_9GAMM|nr:MULTISPECIES: cytochrome-c oxidase, cbb3-type subunit III [Shewanella]AVI67879.1 cytochrome-c oxidase, cbb3-type subunit III [Shewanella sp. WE21]AVT49478.1 cytochrome-c oxidase, cbb3-type subunit III [Shewanella baltica]MBI1675964.1 cytochrome-c oxidase, cbb3-type subunit III [Shewanella sp. DW31]MBP7663560.1 cytochrome-c oxidase, cbb3-type subunit III [Shewanella sp.]MBW3513132.1 cytochrome-c oxidase, cbb3-type subunit III [Shewanella sp. NKUCC01_JLK]
MSSFWSVWITVLSLVVIAGCFLLLRVCSKNTTDVKEGESMGHSFDGIEELNNPLPKWWSYMFYITIVFGLIYLALFPGLGNYKGLLGWTSSNQSIGTEHGIKADSAAAIELAAKEGLYVQYDQEVKHADEKYGPIFAAYLATPLEELVKNQEALKVGGRLFLQNCAQCHGSDARGSKGFPNLTDGDWLYGGELATIKTTIMAGRHGMMPPKGGLPIEDSEIAGLAEYVVKLSGREHDEKLAAQGQGSFMKGCFACHGMDAKGNKFMGAPNLTDDVWLYGGSRGMIEETIKHGRAGVMPAWKDVLGEEKVHVITAYVYSLSNK